jgi:hypothetical protein
MRLGIRMTVHKFLYALARRCRLFLACVSVLFALAAGCTPHVANYSDLEYPIISWIQNGGVCYKLRAIDGQGNLWTGGGCEGASSTLDGKGSVSDAQVAELDMKVDLLSNESSNAALSCPGTTLNQFSHKIDAVNSRTFSVCAQESQFDDLSNVSGGFLSAGQAFLVVFGK